MPDTTTIINRGTFNFVVSHVLLSYLLPWLELRLPVLDLRGVRLVELLELERLVLRQHLALLVLHHLQLLDRALRRRPRLLQLPMVLRLETLLLGAVALLLSLLELKG